ncbi:hypothetical protein CANMA_002347 [Candida margitis]|uniref:uncharacterized protein n=1 Tax=Candida margitis TaxID=1775924 RepID=UPI002225F6EA|nr:uncharacterized protein CANMA_002347 [Candida margitis]KAI5968602.1 hypothetical protein CANMA_002347 [Candida margitis]
MVQASTLTQSALLTTLFAVCCQGAAIDPRSNDVVSVNFEVSYRDALADDDSVLGGSAFDKRSKDEPNRGYIKTDLKHRKSFYTTQLKIGSHKEKITVVVDTGSSDLWVPSSEAKCLEDSKCRSEGTYSVEKSKSSKPLNQPFSIEYPDNETASGVYVQDSVEIGKTTVSNQQFAVANTSTAGMGVLGIGLQSDEQTKDNYVNFVFSLKKQGSISKAGYSLYLPEKEKKSGTILFGGIDEEKYSGNLTQFEVSSDKLSVPLQSVSYSGKDNKNETEAIIDSGSTFSFLPSGIVGGIADALNGSYSDSLGVYVVDCKNRGKKSGYLSFNFENDTSIMAPLSHFVLRLKQIKHHVPDYEKNHCGLSIFPSDDETVLGDNFLRSAYISVDLEDKQVGLAQVKHSRHHSYKSL